jgi:teichoic acid transport system permease protein
VQQQSGNVDAAPVLSAVGVRPSLRDYLTHTWARRAFLSELVSARVSASTSTTLLGPLWLLLTPLLNAVLYFLVFGVLLGANATVEQYPLFLLTGVLLFTFFARGASAASGSLLRQQDLVRSLPFPRILLVLAAVGVEVKYLTWSLLVLGAAAWAACGVSVSWLLAVAAVVVLIGMVTGTGLLLARLTTSFPDTGGLLPFALRAGGYLSGAYFPLDAVAGDSAVVAVLAWNPLAVCLDLARDGLTGQASLPGQWAVVVGTAVVLLLAGMVALWRGEPRYGRD